MKDFVFSYISMAFRIQSTKKNLKKASFKGEKYKIKLKLLRVSMNIISEYDELKKAQ